MEKANGTILNFIPLSEYMEYFELSTDDNFFIRFAPDKITMGFGGHSSQEHLSLSYGLRSKILDIHQTSEKKAIDKDKKHNGKFYLRHFTIGRILVHIRKLMPLFSRWFVGNTVPISVLLRLGIILMDPEKGDESKFVKIDKNGTRLKPQKRIYKKSIEQMYGCICQAKNVEKTKGFIAFRRARGKTRFYGWVFAFPQSNHPQRMILISEMKLRKFLKKPYEEIEKIIKAELDTDKQQILAQEVQRIIEIAAHAK